MLDKVIMNKYGFYTLKEPPSDKEREDYYKNKYYQGVFRGFTIKYTAQELEFFKAKLEQKLLLIKQHYAPHENISFIDIGCGEGFAVKFFKDNGFSVLGLDYSEAGIKNHNSDILDNTIIGDVYESINNLISKEKSFNIVNMDNILEHVTDPFILLEKVYKLMTENGIAIIKVPNDFSVLHKYFIENKIVSKPYWVAPLDHISYFNKEGLINICSSAGFENLDILGNYMTEFFILNTNTNYYENPQVGKSCHLARVAQENILHGISPEKSIALYRILGEMGLGREIIGVFKKRS